MDSFEVIIPILQNYEQTETEEVNQEEIEHEELWCPFENDPILIDLELAELRKYWQAYFGRLFLVRIYIISLLWEVIQLFIFQQHLSIYLEEISPRHNCNLRKVLQLPGHWNCLVILVKFAYDSILIFKIGKNPTYKYLIPVNSVPIKYLYLFVRYFNRLSKIILNFHCI